MGSLVDTPAGSLESIPEGTTSEDIDAQAAEWLGRRRPSGLLGTAGLSRRASWWAVQCRKRGWTLDLSESLQYRKNIETVGLCGRRFASLWRRVWTPAGWRDERISVPKPCGLSCCEKCWLVQRGEKASALLQPWDCLWTLTIPQRSVSREWALRHINSCISRLTKLLRRWWGSRDVAEDGLPEFQFGWVVELHESGYPHVHMCTRSLRMTQEQMLSTWNACTGLTSTNIDRTEVDSPGGIANYLAKYLQKGAMSPEAFAIRYRMRSYYCTFPRPEKELSSWRLETVIPTYVPRGKVHNAARQWSWVGMELIEVTESETAGYRRLWPPGVEPPESGEEADELWMSMYAGRDLAVLGMLERYQALQRAAQRSGATAREKARIRYVYVKEQQEHEWLMCHLNGER